MFSASNIHYEGSDRTRAITCGGIGAMLTMARKIGLVEAIDRELELLKVHLPYSESDHVLNIAFNIMAGGRSLEDIELRRNDENYLNALGAERIPDPTTAGDFCRRFSEADVHKLLDVFNRVRSQVWRQQRGDTFFQEAVIDMDGSLTETDGECKNGMEISYNGVWGYHPLVITLAKTGEVLWLVNRSGNRPSHDGAAAYVDRSIQLAREGGFQDISLRGDTDFSQAAHLDRWDGDDVRFVFGYDCRGNLREKAEELSARAWEKLVRPEKYVVNTQPRSRPDNVKKRIVEERGFKNLRLDGEWVAEFPYKPHACAKEYRMVVLRKKISESRGQAWLFDYHDYFFYITNDWETPAPLIVFDANQRCNQENILKELKGDVRALHAPVNCLVSNWAYMVMASLAWSLKAWFGLLLPTQGRWSKKHVAEKDLVLRMRFRTFVNSFIQLPAQIVQQGRKVVYRLLGWNPKLPIFFRCWKHIRTLLQLT